MSKAKAEKNESEKNEIRPANKPGVIPKKDDSIDESESDGSANAFEETERVEEDNYDDLSEK
jgi:hypothetical protein